MNVRYFALFALLPLHWDAGRKLGEVASFARRIPSQWRTGVLTAVVLCFTQSLGGAINRIGVEQRPYHASVPLWDLAAISIRERTLLIPSFAIRENDFELSDLRKYFHPHRANFLSVDESRSVIGYYHLDADQANRVLRAWIQAIVRHPRAYLRHRATVMRKMWFDPALRSYHGIQMTWNFRPMHLRRDGGFSRVFVDPSRPGVPLVRRDDLLAMQNRPVYVALRSRIESLELRSIAYQTWIYWLGCALLLWVGRFLDGPQGRAAQKLLGVGLLSVVLLPLVAPSTDFRYSIGAIAGALFGSAFALASLRSGEGRWLRRLRTGVRRTRGRPEPESKRRAAGS